MMKHGVCSSLMLGVWLFATGCGGDNPKGSESKGGSGNAGGSAGMQGGSAGAGGSEDNMPPGGSAGTDVGGSPSAGTGGTGGMGGGGTGNEVITFESQPAGIELEVDAVSKAAGVTLRSSSLIQDPSTTLFYTEWRAALYNGTAETQCFIEMTGDFQDAAGASIIQFHTFAYGNAYDTGTGLGLTTACAAPGETVPIWSNDNPMMALPLSSIDKLVLSVTPMARPEAVLHPSTPTLGPLTKEYTALEWWQISGTATSTADIYNVKLAFWGKVGEFFVDEADAFHSEDFLQGQPWAFETIAGIDSVTLDEVVSHFSFIDGREGALASVHLDERDTALVKTRDRAVSLWDAAEQRRNEHRALR